MVRLYGKAPYKFVLVHGGPGAAGSLRGFAEELSRISEAGVVEAIQSQYSINELIEELYCQIKENCAGRVSLIGHSWGAWLAVLLAERYPEAVDTIVLIGCPPLEEKYVSEIVSRRLQNLSGEDKAAFQRLLDNRAEDEDMAKPPAVLERADNYCLENKGLHSADKTDSRMYNSVWNEAAKRRADGKILASFKKVRCRLCLIQGECDPHPAEGVTVPLLENDMKCETYILEKCGHSPFMEKYAKDKFYQILLEICTII